MQQMQPIFPPPGHSMYGHAAPYHPQPPAGLDLSRAVYCSPPFSAPPPQPGARASALYGQHFPEHGAARPSMPSAGGQLVPMPHPCVLPAHPALMNASNALAILHYLCLGHPGAGPHGTCLPHTQSADKKAAMHPSERPEQETDDLGPIVDVRGLRRREHGRRISAFNFFVKEMVPQIRVESPYLMHQACMKRVAETWQAMSKEEKAKW